MDFEVYSFEPNQKLNVYYQDIQKKLGKKHSLFNKAVHIEDGIITFFENPNYSCAGTTNKTKGEKENCGSYVKCDQTNIHKVESIDLCSFIKGKFNSNDYIILKLDVEGSEFDIVPSLLKENTFEFINEFYIEWHFFWCEEPKNKEAYYKNLLKNRYNLEMKPRDAQPYKIE
jgi:FkbM family methyltransferase